MKSNFIKLLKNIISVIYDVFYKPKVYIHKDENGIHEILM